MKSSLRKITSVTLSAIMVCALAAGCSSSSSDSTSTSAPASNATASAAAAVTEEAKEPTPLMILSPEDGRVVVENNPVWLELEARTNTELELLLLPGADIPSKLNTMAASNTLPDIVKYSNFFPYAAQGVLLDIEDLVQEYAPNMTGYLPEYLWDYTTYQGTVVAIPYYNEAGKYVMSIRQDWLDYLDLDMPETLDDLYEIAAAFATGDPDQNGQKDTYAFGDWEDFMPIFGAYGIQVLDDRYYYIEDNQVYCTYASPYYKEAMTFINKLWSENLIDPDFVIMQSDQYRQKLAQGSIGMITAWWSIVPEIVVGQLGFNELNPDGEWAIIESAPTGSGGPWGDSGLVSRGEYQNATWLSANTSYPVEAIQFLDYLFTDEGFELTYFGIQGVHYTTLKEGRTAEGQAGFDEKWLDSFNQIAGKRIDITQYLRTVATDETVMYNNQYQSAALNYNLQLNDFFGMPSTDDDMTYGSELLNFEKENRIAFMTGERSLDEFDSYVKEWLDRGGREILQAQVDQYNELKGTNLEPGLQ